MRLARVYKFPDKYEQEIMTYEQIQALREEQALEALRQKARLEMNKPLPWYKRLAKWYDENYEQVFEGTGAAIAFLTVFMLIIFVLVNFARSMGWWGW